MLEAGYIFTCVPQSHEEHIHRIYYSKALQEPLKHSISTAHGEKIEISQPRPNTSLLTSAMATAQASLNFHKRFQVWPV